MELYILSKQDLSILSICKLADYQINLDEETNAKSTFTLMKTNGLKKGNYMTLNGLYRQFIFVIDDVQTEKNSNVVTVTALDISNIFDRKVIEKNIDTMKSKSIEEFLANTISENFVNSDDTALNVNYIEIYWHTNTQGNVATNAENGLYNFHTFLINCRQYKNIYTDFKLENLGNPQTVEGKRISLEAKNRKIVDISLHGESTQNGTPTPDDKVDIENVEGNIEFKVEGKNIVNINNENVKKVNCTKVIDGNSLTLTSTSTATLSRLHIPIKYELNTQYTFSFKTTILENNTSAKPMIYFRKGNTSIYGTTLQLDTETHEYSVSVTGFAEEGYELWIYIKTSAVEGTISVKIDEMQLEKGTTATDYEPYKSQVATFPLGEGQKLMEGSYLADYGIHHSRKQVVFDGSDDENWQIESTNNFYSNIVIQNSKSSSLVLCNYQKSTQKGLGESENCFISTSKKFNFQSDTINHTVADFKNWLSTHNLIVEYELAEPETVPYTEEQQTAWNNIKNLTLFEGVNHISSDANMVLKYYPLKPVGLKFVLRIDIENKQERTELIDTTLPEVTDYNKIYEEDVTAKVQVYIREDGSEYNLYLKTDRTTTTNKDDPNRASGKIEVISVDTADKAAEEALNVIKGNNYKHLVEFKIAKTSKLMDITELHIGRPIRIKTEDDIYDSYISAITLSDENFVYFKSGSLRITLLDKLKKTSNTVGDKLDRTGGKITGNLDISGTLKENGKKVITDLDNINTEITSVTVPALAVKTDTTEHVLKSFTIETAGRYMFLADVPLNYYGATGRTLYLNLKVNNTEKFVGGGVINTNAYTLYTKLLTVADVPANGTIEITLKNDIDGKQFACLGFNLQYFKLK